MLSLFSDPDPGQNFSQKYDEVSCALRMEASPGTWTSVLGFNKKIVNFSNIFIKKVGIDLDPDPDLGWFRTPQGLYLDPDTDSGNLDPQNFILQYIIQRKVKEEWTLLITLNIVK